MNNKNIKLILIQFLAVALMLVFLSARSKGLSPFLFWPIVWLLVIFSFIIVYNLPKAYKTTAIIILTAGISLIQIVVLPEIYYMGRDSIFESQFASIITEQGRWNPSLGKGFAEDYYGYNPALHFALSFASLTTNLNAFLLLRYLFFILFRVMFALLTLLLVSNFVDSKKSNIPHLATLFFTGLPGMAFIGVTRRSMASIFLILAILAILKSGSSKNKKTWNLLFMLFSFMVVLADHSISYYFLLFLIGAWIFSKLVKIIQKSSLKQAFSGITYKTIYFIIIFLAWNVFSKGIFIIRDIDYIKKLIEIALSSLGILSFLNISEASLGVNIYRFYETFIIYSAQLFSLLLGFFGLLFFIKDLIKRKALPNKEGELLYAGLFSFALFIFSSLIMRSALSIAAGIFLWFPCIFISFFIAYLLEKVIKKSTNKKIYFAFAMSLLIYLFTASLMMGIFTPRITNRAPREDIVVELDRRSKNDELFYSGFWADENINKSKKFLGDIDVYEVFSGFYRFDANSYDYWLKKMYLGNENDIQEIIEKQDIEFGMAKHTLKRGKLSYLVVNKAFFKYQSNLFGEPISPDNIKKFDENAMLNKVYNNNEIIIYKINRGNEIE